MWPAARSPVKGTRERALLAGGSIRRATSLRVRQQRELGLDNEDPRWPV